jgi:hypothetical protein
MIQVYCTIEDVKNLSQVKPEQLRLDKEDVTGLDAILTEWISQSEALINTHCHRSFREETNEDTLKVVKNVCSRMVANMISQAGARQDTAVIKVNEWRVEYVKDEIFTQSLKDDLKEFIVEKSTKSDPVDFFAITGVTGENL